MNEDYCLLSLSSFPLTDAAVCTDSADRLIILCTSHVTWYGVGVYGEICPHRSTVVKDLQCYDGDAELRSFTVNLTI